VILSSCVGHTG